MKTRLHTLVAAILFGLFATGPVALADGDAASGSEPSFSEVAMAKLMELFGMNEKLDADYPTPSAGSEHPIIRNPT